MTARVLGLAAVAAAAIGAAGVGGYLAARTAPVTAPARQVATTPEPSATAPATSAVAETEGVVPTDKDNKEKVSAAVGTPVERPAAPAPPAASPKPTSTAVSKPAAPSRAPVQNRPAGRATSDPSPQAVAHDESPRPPAQEPVSHDPAASASEPVKPAEERPAVVEPPPPPAPRVEDFVVPADSVIGLQLDDTVSTDSARVEQRIRAHVTRDVRVNSTVVIPAGAKAEGQVTLVEPGGKFRERARLGIRFHTLVLADGTSVPIQTDAIFREGDEVGQRSAARIGGSAVGGAIIGAIFGGGKGAAIGAAAGAGAGTAATMATQKSQVTLHAGSTVTVRLTNPATVTVERED